MGRYEVKIVMEHVQMWNYDTNGGENLCYKSRQKFKSITPIYKFIFYLNQQSEFTIIL
jgi:hypothetical protein